MRHLIYETMWLKSIPFRGLLDFKVSWDKFVAFLVFVSKILILKRFHLCILTFEPNKSLTFALSFCWNWNFSEMNWLDLMSWSSWKWFKVSLNWASKNKIKWSKNLYYFIAPDSRCEGIFNLNLTYRAAFLLNLMVWPGQVTRQIDQPTGSVKYRLTRPQSHL